MSDVYDVERAFIELREATKNSHWQTEVVSLAEQSIRERFDELEQAAACLAVERAEFRREAESLRASVAELEAKAAQAVLDVEGVIEKIVEYGWHRENEGGSYATFQKFEARKCRAEADDVIAEIRAMLASRTSAPVAPATVAVPDGVALPDHEVQSVVSGLRRATELLRRDGYHPEGYDFRLAAELIEKKSGLLQRSLSHAVRVSHKYAEAVDVLRAVMDSTPIRHAQAGLAIGVGTKHPDGIAIRAAEAFIANTDAALLAASKQQEGE